MDDITPPQPTEPETPKGSFLQNTVKAFKGGPLWLKIIAIPSPFLAIIAFVIGIAIVFAMMRIREPAPNTTALAAGMHCASWASAYAGYQDSITNAANEFKIPPALLGAIFLSEHGQSWPQRDMSGTWDTEGKIQGPFQFDTSDTGSWNGLVANQSTFKGYSADSFEQSVRVAAFYLKGLIDTPRWDASNLTDNQIRCVAAGFNKGGSVCAKWIGKGFSGDPVGVDLEYDKRALKSYKDLNKGCTSYSGSVAGALDVFYLSQRDPAWNSPTFTNGAKYFPKAKSFAGAGCGATSAAMVVRYLTNKSVTPVDTAEKFLSCHGSWAAFSESCFLAGVSGKEITQDQVDPELKKNHPVILRIVNGYVNPLKKNKTEHNNGGHYVVIKVIQDGYYVTADPNGSPNERYSTVLSKYIGGVKFFSFSE